MARNRIIKKEFYTDQKMIELDIVERLLFIGMTNFADDTGIHINSAKMLKAEILPADEISIDYIEEALSNMHKLGLIEYNEDRSLFRITNFLIHQKINRPYPSKYEFVEESETDSMNVHGTFNECSSPNKNNNKKKNNKNKKKKKDNENSDFLVWWEMYPRKIGKPKAQAKFEEMVTIYSLREVIEGTILWKDYWKNAHTETKYIPHPTTFLNQHRFMDYPDELESQIEVEYRLDTTGKFYIGYCAKCQKSNFYRKEELRQDSRCCKDKILPQRDAIEIQDVNAKA